MEVAKKSLYAQLSPAQLAGAYLLAALAWLFASDRIFGVFRLDATQLVCFSVANGFCFVGLTALLFYRLLARAHDRAEAEVRKQEAYADELFAAAPEAACLIDPDTRILRVNERFTCMFGYSNQEAAGRRLDELIVPAGMSVSEQLEEGTRMRKDGTCLEVSMAATPARVNGRPALCIVYRDLTERRRVEQQYKVAAERLKAILENARVGIVLTDFKGHLLESNAALQQLLGYTADELSAMSFVDYTHPDDVQRNLELFQQLRAGKVQSYQLEKRFFRKDGTVVWGRAVAVRLGGELALSMIEDITARKQMEQQLQATVQRLTAILNRAPVGIDVSNDEGGFLEVNPAFERITGYSAEELKGMTFYQLTHPDEHARNRELVAELKAGKVPSYEMEKRYRRKDGKTIWVRVTGSRVDAEHTMGIVEDITERKEAAAQLQATAERLQAILEHAPVGIVVTDREGRLVEFNAAHQRMCGYSAEELRGASFTQYTHPDDIAKNMELFSQTASGARPSVEIEKRFVRKDGQVIWVRVISSRLNKDYMIGIVEDVTAHQQAEEQLRATAERLQAILENAPLGISITDPRDGHVLESNAAFQRLVGYSAEELKGMSLKDYTHPDDMPYNLKLLEELKQGKSQRYELEKRYLRRDGKTVWVRARRSRLSGEHSIGIVEDITEHKEALEQLRRSEARFRNLIESSIIGIFVGGADGRVSYANDAFLAITGYTAEDIAAGVQWRDLNPPEYRPLMEQKADDIRRTGKFHPYEKEYLRKDGSRVPVMVGGALAEGGGVVVFVVDLTERQQQQLELERLARIVESADDAIVSLSLDSIILSWNQGAERLLGYSKAEMIGASEEVLLPPDSGQELEQVRQVVAGGKALDYFKTVRIAKSGEEKPVWVRINPIRDAGGKVIGISKIARDRSQVIKNQQLEEQLRQAQKLESLGRLAGGVAHDFNNLLMVISSYGEMLQERLRLDSDAQKYTQQILHASERAASLTQQMLAFSRKQVLAPRVIDLNATVEETAKMMKRLIGEDIELVFRPGKPLASIEADPSQITQVLLNLGVNARDAMPRGGTITIATQNAEADASMVARHPGFAAGNYVMLTVTDTGVGMTKEVQERIFEPFFTTKPTGQGTGLGLSTVYGIVRQSNGYIWVYSEPGHGTSFKLYFHASDKQAAEVAPSSRQKEGEGETILVVEDEEALRRAVCEHLKTHGYRVLEACRGQNALAVAQQHPGPIHLLLTDVIMPGMSGPETAAQLRKLPTRQDVRTLYMSGYPDDAVINHGVSQAGVGLIQKPFSLASLTHKLRELLAASAGGPA